MNVIETIVQALNPSPKRQLSPEETVTAFIVVDTDLKAALGAADFEAWLGLARTRETIFNQLNYELTDQHAQQLWKAQVEGHTKDAAAGKKLTDAGRGRSRDAWFADVEAKRFAARQAYNKVIADLAPFHARIADALVNKLNSHCADVMLAEAKIAQKFGLSYTSSQTLTTLQGAVTYIKNRGHILAAKKHLK